MHADTHGHGLAQDLDLLMRRKLERRRMLRRLAGAGLAPLGLLACGGGGDDAGTTTSTSSSASSSSGSSSSTTTCAAIPEETAGPYPGDGSNSNPNGVVNALALSGIVRSDIRSSIAGATGVADGVPLAVQLELVDTGASCAGLAGYAIYLWHYDREGLYSLYSAGVTDENYLRGVQETDANGIATFTTIFPGCYSGRMPHIHFEIYRSLATATASTSKLRTSQLAFPLETCNAVYASSGYEASVTNLARISFSTDNVFSDGTSLQMSSISGDATSGYVATLQVGVAA